MTLTKVYKKIITSLAVVALLAGIFGFLAGESVLADTKNNNDPAANGAKCDANCLMITYVNPFVKVLSAMVGVVVTISIVYGGIEYASSGGDPGKAAAGKKRIYNAVLALLAYLFLFAFLNWVLPGGII